MPSNKETKPKEKWEEQQLYGNFKRQRKLQRITQTSVKNCQLKLV